MKTVRFCCVFVIGACIANSQVGVPWRTETVDTIKADDPETPVTGIAATMMATFDVLQRAAAAGKNLVITHEPTFYSHLDSTAIFEKEHNPVWADKEKFIREHKMVVFRFSRPLAYAASGRNPSRNDARVGVARSSRRCTSRPLVCC